VNYKQNRFWQYFKKDMNQKDWIFLFAIVIFANLFRLLFMVKSYAIGFDQVNYLKLAASGKLFGLNHVFHTYWSPFYPLAVTLFSYIVPNFETAGRMFSILCASLIIIPLFFFIKEHFNKHVAFGTSLLIAFYSFSAYFSAKAEAEFIYSFVAISGIILGWSVLKNEQILKSLFVGMLFGAAYLSRPEGVGFLIVFWAVVLIVLFSQIFTRKTYKNYVFILLLSGIGFGIISFPYLYFLHRETGKWTLSTKGTSNQQGEMYVKNADKFAANPFHVLSEDNKRLFQDEIYHLGTFIKTINNEGQPVVKVSIKALVTKIFENLYKLITESFTNVLPVPLIILFGLGLFVTPWVREQTLLNLYLLSFIAFFWFLIIPVFHITLRYFVPLLPLSFIWIANGADKFSDWFAATLKNSLTKIKSAKLIHSIGFVIVVFIVLASAILPEFGRRMKKNMFSADEWAPCIEQKKAGVWLKQNVEKSPVVMSYNHAVSFYAGNYNIKESVEIPVNTIDRVLEYAKYRGVNYLVLNDRYKHKNPLIDHLFDQKDVPPELELIYQDAEQNGFRTLIYKLNN